MSKLPAFLRNFPLSSFFALAYGLSWLACLPHLLWEWGVVRADVRAGFLLKQWVGPAAAALVMATLRGGRAARRRLRASGRRWRVSPVWYLVALVGAPALVLVGVLLVCGPPAVPVGVSFVPVLSWLGSFALVFLAVGLPEELGWRGFALPRLQERFGPLRGTLLLGALWALWHLPFFLTSDHGGGPGVDAGAVAANFAVFTAMVVALSVLFTVVFNRTGGSVLLVALLHTAIDTGQITWLPLLLPVGLANSTSGEFTLDLALLCTFGPAALAVALATRGRLGYPGAVGTPVDIVAAAA